MKDLRLWEPIRRTTLNNQEVTKKKLKMFSIVCMCLFVFMETACVWTACASETDEKHSVPATQIQTTLTADLAAQANPDGLMLMTGGYRRWVQETAEDGMQTKYVQAGLGLGVSPAYVKGSIHGEWQPAIFACLRLEYDIYGFFGSNTGLLSFPDEDARFGKQELEDREGTEEEATGHRLLFQPTLYAKAGSILIINQTDLAYFRFDGDGPCFLELEYDTLVKDGDFVIANRTQFMVPSWKGAGKAVLYLGPYYEITFARNTDITRQRAGGQLYWLPMDTLWGMNKPRIYSQAGVNIQDRNRDNELYMVFGFGTDFNL
jgi:hypothetical protein